MNSNIHEFEYTWSVYVYFKRFQIYMAQLCIFETFSDVHMFYLKQVQIYMTCHIYFNQFQIFICIFHPKKLSFKCARQSCRAEGIEINNIYCTQIIDLYYFDLFP